MVYRRLPRVCRRRRLPSLLLLIAIITSALLLLLLLLAASRVPTDPPTSPAPVAAIPLSTATPRIVYYLWCEPNGTSFTFVNYLSVLSSIRFLQPERIVLLYSAYPTVDSYRYNTWLDDDLLDVFPFVQTKALSWPAVRHACENAKAAEETMYDFLHEGGLFLGISTVLTAPATWLWQHRMVVSGDGGGVGTTRFGLLASAPKNGTENVRYRRPDVVLPPCQWVTNLNSFTLSSTTSSASSLSRSSSSSSSSKTPLCLTLALDIYPRDLWTLSGSLGRLLNLLMYDRLLTPEPIRSPHLVVPNIAHVLWLNGKPIDFVFYLCALSLLYVVRVEKLYVHGNLEPRHTGYWKQLVERERPRLTFILRQKPDTIYGQHTNSPHVMSDIFRAEIMNKYGGIYSDVDVIWTQPISDELRKYDAVAAFDWAHNYYPYPDYVNLGVSLGRPGAPFWKLFLRSFKTFRPNVFGFNGLLQPYKLYERHPDSLRVYRRLQVMCFR